MALVVGGAIPVSTAAAGGGAPPDRLLTGKERAAVMAGMDANERAVLGPLFKDKDSLIVGYARNVVEFDVELDGTLRPRPTGDDDGTTLRIDALTPMPDTAGPQVAAGALRAGVVGTMATTGSGTPGTSLYQTLTILRHCGTCLQWNIHHYYSWSGTTGMGPNNGNKDRIGMAWNKSWLDLKDSSYYFSGHYTSGASVSPTDQYISADWGVGWSFREWQNSSLGYYSDWGYGNASVITSSYHATNTVFKAGYAHTGLSNTGGSITFAQLTINFNGSDDFEWTFTLSILT